jgi:hypothetical protein
MAAEKVHTAMDLKDAVAHAHAGHDPFQEHLKAADKEEMLKIDQEVEEALNSPRPSHEVLDKLLAVKESLGKAAHVQVAPEDAIWRAELDEAVKGMEQAA